MDRSPKNVNDAQNTKKLGKAKRGETQFSPLKAGREVRGEGGRGRVENMRIRGDERREKKGEGNGRCWRRERGRRD